MANNEPTIASILRALAAQYDGPVTERQVLERVLEQRPSTAKNPYATIRERLRWDGLALGWLRLDRNELVPLRVVLQGLRFRCVPQPWEIEAGLLALTRLQPFVGLRSPLPILQDTNGTPLTSSDTLPPGIGRRFEVQAALPGFDLRAWYARSRFALGDSILVTVTATDPLTLRIEYEPAANFRATEVATQDAELAEAIFERVYRSQQPLIPCDELILPVFARAAWRTSYPGHTWQQLVLNDLRLQLVDDTFVALRQHDTTYFSAGDPLLEHRRESDEAALLTDIDTLQQELQKSRQQDADAGLWTGQIQRASTAYTLFDGRTSDDFAFHPDPLDDDLDGLDIDEWGDDSLGPELIETNEFDPLLMDESSLLDASQRLMAALPRETVERLHNATPAEAEVLIAAHLNDLLVREPSLFAKIDLSPLAGQDVAERAEGTDSLALETLWTEDMSDWEDDWEDDFDDISGEAASVYAQSSELMAQFHDHLMAAGKSTSTARSRTRNLWVYAEFLAYYYGRTLAEGDYATLDECLFFFYPRKVMNSSTRQVREICTSLKQFYRFLIERGDIADDRFAYALWRRRDQAARVVELYHRLSNDSPNFEQLFIRLFAPYTL